MPDQFLWDVFLSHSHRDRPRVARLAERLRERGLRVWLDDWVIQPGDDIYAAIENGLELSRTLLLCLSQAAIDSDWVKLERNTTLFRDPMNKERRFIPLLLEECQLPATLTRFLYVDWRAEAEAELAKLIEACAPPPKPKPAKPKTATEAQTPPSGAMPPGHPRYLERLFSQESAMSAPEAQLRLTVGGAVNPRTSVYIIRPSDDELLALLERGEYCNVLCSRQMGKTSLLKRTRARLVERGYATAEIEVAGLLGSPKDADEWYQGLLDEIARQLRLPVNVPDWWRATSAVTANQKLIRFFREEVIAKIPGDKPIIIFLDALSVTGDSLQIATLRYDRVESEPIAGDPKQLLDDWQRRLGLKINDAGEIVPLWP